MADEEGGSKILMTIWKIGSLSFDNKFDAGQKTFSVCGAKFGDFVEMQ